MYIVSVLVEHPVHKLDTTFDYLSNELVEVGVRVGIGFGYQNITGYVMACNYSDKTKAQLEEMHGYKFQYIRDVIDEKPLFNEELQHLALSLSKLTLAPQIACMQTMLPPSLKPSSSKKVSIKYQKIVVLKNASIVAKTTKQMEAVEYIKEHNLSPIDRIPYSTSILDNLCKQGIIEYQKKEVLRGFEKIDYNDKNIQLTVDQQNVVDGIIRKRHQSFVALLHGVTGSGKTEVYLHLASEMLKQNKNVIMLVPEIALTPMMVEAFVSKFQEKVAILHSKLSNGERYDQYRAIASKKVSIVVGARSAIFAPLDNIGLIILDEEHDSSYKQESVPKYHTHQIAILRSKYHKCGVLLASATPSMESYSKAKAGIYDFYALGQRINKQALPKITLIDIREEIKQGNYSMLSRTMKEKLQECINNQQQAILFLNKRGYANYVRCIDCGSVVQCPHCDVSLTYHKASDMLHCHYCNYQTTIPQTCPTCNSDGIKKIGSGIQKVEELIEKEIVGAKVIRYDVDTTRQKKGHSELLKAFENKEANILLGTQMVAKGLDFEDVTFVGVLNADISLHLPDFRCHEKTFQLLVQVAGRAGRGSKIGEVYIQTMDKEHQVLKAVQKHDYNQFYKDELEFRKLANYPPFCNLTSILVESKDENIALVTSNQIHEYLSSNQFEGKILGPSKSTIYKTKDMYRYRILLKYTKVKAVYPLLESMSRYYNKNSKNVRVTCDFNPYNQM